MKAAQWRSQSSERKTHLLHRIACVSPPCLAIVKYHDQWSATMYSHQQLLAASEKSVSNLLGRSVTDTATSR